MSRAPSRRRRLLLAFITAASALGSAATAHAQQHAVSLNLGYFAVRGEDARIEDDVIVENLGLFAFDVGDFNNAAVGGDWLIGFGDFLEAGLGASFYRRTVPSIYDDFVDRDGSEIEQDFKLRVAPLTATLRFFPFGLRRGVQPYVGGGLAVLDWRYSEVGEFVDFNTLDIFRDRFVAEGTDVGAVVLGGLRFAVGSRYGVGAEIRYHEAHGTVGIDKGFLDERLDLTGITSQLTFQVKF